VVERDAENVDVGSSILPPGTLLRRYVAQKLGSVPDVSVSAIDNF